LQDLKRYRNLEYFVANGNELEEIPDEAFSIPGGNVVDILLHDNRIKKLGKRPFGNLPQLNAVTLHNNMLGEVKGDNLYFTGPVQTVSLRGNQISKVDKEAFG
jgi:Leucine-rich repeat (LRR) protein